MKNVTHKKETTIKAPMRFAGLVQFSGILGFAFLFANLIYEWVKLSNWFFALAAAFYFAGAIMGAKLTHEESIQSPHSIS